MFFIHKYKDGSVVKFTKIPQVKHKRTTSLAGVVRFSYIETIRGRIAMVNKIYKQDIDTAKESYYERIESKYFFSCVFLDNGEVLELQACNTMIRAKVNLVNLMFYKLYQLFCPDKFK